MIYNAPVLQVQPTGGLQDNPLGKPAARWLIKNLVNGHAWTGHGFSPDEYHAALYADVNEACHDMHSIMLRVYGDERLHIYEAPCRVRVYGEAQMRDVQRWLSRASILKLRTEDFHNGPHRSLVLPTIYWGDMERVEHE